MKARLLYAIVLLDENENEVDRIHYHTFKKLVSGIKKYILARNTKFDVYVLRHEKGYNIPPGRQIWFYDNVEDSVCKYSPPWDTYYSKVCKSRQRKLYKLMTTFNR